MSIQNVFCSLLLLGGTLTAAVDAAEVPDIRGEFRFAATATRFDISRPLREMTIIPPGDLSEDSVFFGSMMIDPETPGKWTYGKQQDVDKSVQGWTGPPLLIPAPSQNFNVGTGTANPPDPVGDVGPNHYVRMSNASFQIFNKATGVSVFGPANINTLWAGFGGACQTENAGDPIVIYDQFADRWLLTQFSDSTGPFFNCVALSQTGDPTGAYYRWQFPAAVFPDYPKYGVWPNAYIFTTRELGTPVSKIGVYAVDRAQMIAGNPTPTVVSFFNNLDPGVAQYSGDGLLPADVDGSTLPPSGSPAFLVASMDNGGPYGAVEDALALWKFTIDFAVPANSSLVLSSVLPIAPYDTIFPCTGTQGRACIPQPAPLQAIDILSYRQRPVHRAAYRNYGSYESIVTNQSVEAAPGMAGIRWWEIRSPNAAPLLYQDSTFAPGVTDGVHRWMASISADRSGNMAMGYSTSSAVDFPGIRYTGRLESDQLGQMAQGEGTFVTGAGGNSQGSIRRWGDYTSMNIDVDDCTFWYINEFFATTGTTWTLRAGSFKFPECGQPSFGIAAVPLTQQICTPNTATFNVEAHAYSGFSGSATLSASGNPSGSTTGFAPAGIGSIPGTSVLSVNSGSAAFGSYPITVSAVGGSPSALRTRTVNLDVFTTTPAGPSLLSPVTGAGLVPTNPLLSWSAPAQGVSYIAEVATDAAFTNIVYTSPSTKATSAQVPPVLVHNTNYFWRVRSANICGTGGNSATFTFTTRPLPGQCQAGNSPTGGGFFDNMDGGVNGWTIEPLTGTTWTQSTARPSSGTTSWLAVDVAVTSDQKLISPAIALPVGRAPLLLRFRHDVSMENNSTTGCFDGGFVEISTNGGTVWAPLPANKVLEDFYDGPLGDGTQAWCGIQPYTTASFDLDAYAGQNVKFRFHAMSDSSVGNVPHGWYVDDVSVVGCAGDSIFTNGFEP